MKILLLWGCGAIKALWEDDGTTQSQFIHAWVSIAASAKKWVKDKLPNASTKAPVKACEQRAIV